jgi:hypothetical protein
VPVGVFLSEPPQPERPRRLVEARITVRRRRPGLKRRRRRANRAPRPERGRRRKAAVADLLALVLTVTMEVWAAVELLVKESEARERAQVALAGRLPQVRATVPA